MIPQFKQPAEDTLRRKRLKVISACTECRRKKTRCDGAQPCASCNKAKVECRYVSSKNTAKETVLGMHQQHQHQQQQQQQQQQKQQQQQQQQQQQLQQQQQPQLQQQRQSPFQHHSPPHEDYRRSSLTTSFNSQKLSRGMRPSFSSSATTIPPTSRHSFSHFASQPTPSRSRPSQESQRHTSASISTMASIEERLAAIERILRALVESSIAQSAIVNKDLIEQGLTTNANGMKGVAHPYLTDNNNNHNSTNDNNAFSLPPSKSNGSTDITRDYLRLPPLYNNSNNNIDPTSATVQNHSSSTAITTISSPPSPSPPLPPTTSTSHGVKERTGLSTGSAQRIDHHGDDETSSPSLPPMITGFKRPHDATTGQVSTTLQPIYVTTAPLDHAVQHTNNHQSSAAGIDHLSPSTTTATTTTTAITCYASTTSTHDDQYPTQHSTLTTIPL